MYIYKITNKINGKIYIGQSINDINVRFTRHINDALSGRLQTHLANAIRKYGKDAFSIEVLDIAFTQEELTQKEYFWINKLNACKYGYNETNNPYKCGGNTYQFKNESEMKKISNKISKTKLKDKNPNARRVKCKNMITNEEYHFNSFIEMQEFFNEKNHSFITERCYNQIAFLYKGKWNIAFEENDYSTDVTFYKNNNKSVKIFVEDLTSNMIQEFPSFASAERFFNLPQKAISGKAYMKGNVFIIHKKYKITVAK